MILWTEIPPNAPFSLPKGTDFTMNSLEQIGKNARVAERELSVADAFQRNKTLLAIADALEENSSVIISANEKDIENGRAAGMSESLLDRLALSEARIKGMASGVRDVAALEDPLEIVEEERTLYNGMELKRVSVPLGVIGIIYEARPNVTSDAAALCLKSGNVTVLRGGKEAINSNKAIADVMRKAIESSGLPADCVQLVTDTTRQSATDLMQLTDYLDLLIPRGGAGLIKATVENAKVPVIETGTGNCHAFVDESADLSMAVDIVFNAKCSRPSVCNALESLLVHKAVAEEFLPMVAKKLAEKNTVLLGCERTKAILPETLLATEEDYATEFLDYKLSVKVVDDIDEAISHIMKYTTGHSECIITENEANARLFQRKVDAAAVYVNASTRFTDGGEFGLGAEIGISTQKMHARGPMGLKQLTSYKYLIVGKGQVR